ncbi:mannose-1-phosphate guanylyltransferase/mannose-6-phosphate isomerase [Helicobacter monodelphidis]|uniref:mannose-1-phosphate guanylyltransferase/mannose-6-phosphate isomerase n=1 Tax=Helicobacter sp. 15-1451 TaxID=2004995 RepID=UPI000DCC7FAE|nr:mannose-1-phosphate guanylyltransferase/mannose-6-phosphate isomerase [Helicobacter sp. 15-1451]RAX58812.1 mannose-1-phosphate guanylyltransferase/mannose-6-phosphate isomerase [Helicobacter sp. 15-1451]
MVTLILCGGSGTRLWPISRGLMPKQFLSLFEGDSLFQKCIKRNMVLSDAFLIVTHSEYYFLASDQLKNICQDNQFSFILEENAKNTAIAIALGALSLPANEIILVAPSDHLIKNQYAYNQVITRAKELAQEGYIVTCGVPALYPESGFGYIQARGENILSFKEKPDYETAQKYIAQGDYFWNSGLFCFQAHTFLEELKQHAPHIYETAQSAIQNSSKEYNYTRIKEESVCHLEPQSIDYALIEKSQKIKMVESHIEWSDIGSFDALYQELSKDSAGNTQSNALLLDSTNNLILTSKRQIALVEVDNLMIVDTHDALLVVKRGSGQRVREVIAKLKKEEKNIHHTHLLVYRPWGTYKVLKEEKTYKIKRIIVNPGKSLSLQKHFHRSEHWVVVSGNALVRLKDKEVTLCPNESIYIPVGEIHRLSNPDKIPLVIIEVQIGSYLGEDDIVRLDDDYHKKERNKE